MKNFIEELYYGNIDPQARGFTKNSRIKKAYDKITELEKLLNERLDSEEKELFISFVNTSSEITAESELDTFIVGFRLGARFVYDTFVNDNDHIMILLNNRHFYNSHILHSINYNQYVCCIGE